MSDTTLRDLVLSCLDHALRFHKDHGDGDCPVCGNKGAMNEEWHQTRAATSP